MTVTAQIISKPVILFCVVMTALLLTASVLMAGGGSQKLASTWLNEKITIDGDTGEWNDHTFYLDDLKGVVNVCNNNEYLYLCFLSADRDVMRQIMMSGMTIWFDAANDKNKAFGLRFSVGRGERPDRGDPQASGINPGMRDGSSPTAGQIDEAEIQKRFAERIAQVNTFEILGPDSSRQTVSMSDSLGIAVKTGFARGAFMYELRLPLERHDGRRYSINTAPGGSIAIGFHSPAMDRKRMTGGERGGPSMSGGTPPEGGGRGGGMGGRPGGGMGGGRGGMGGGRGGMGGGRGGMGQRPGGDIFKMPEPFEVWVTVKLATQ